MAILDITQPKASRHLRTLYHGGLVADRRDRLCVNLLTLFRAILGLYR
jgi:DNA-binding transcriptional ArsR family regulator